MVDHAIGVIVRRFKTVTCRAAVTDPAVRRAILWMQRLSFPVVITILATVLNLGYVLTFDRAFTVASDAEGYDRGAVSVFEGRGFPKGVSEGMQPKREPGMYVFLAAVYSLFGHEYRAVRVAQALLASMFPFLTFLIARRLSRAGALPDGTPVAAAVLVLVCPAFMFYVGVLMRETLLTFVFLLSLLVLTDYVLRPRLRQAVLYGVLVGLGGLIDGRLMYFPVFFCGVWAVVLRQWRPAAVLFAAGFGVALLVIAPWAIRNYVVLDRFVLLTTQQYKGLWLATNPDGILEWDWEREPLRSLRDVPPHIRDQQIADLAIQNLRDYPVRYMGFSVQRFFRLWFGGSHSSVMPLLEQSLASAVAAREWGYALLKLAFVGLHYFFVFGGLAGLIVCVRRAGLGPVVPLVAFLAYITFMHMVLFATPRYHVPALPILIIFLGSLLAVAAERIAQHNTWGFAARTPVA